MLFPSLVFILQAFLQYESIIFITKKNKSKDFLKQNENCCLQSKKRILTRYLICWYLDLGLPASGTMWNKCLLFKSAVIYHSSLNQLWQLACVIKSHFRELFVVITLMTFKQNKNLFWTFRIIFFWTFRTNVEFFKCLILFGPRVFQGKSLIWEFFTSGQDE